MDWSSASTHCTNKGGYLMVLNNPNELSDFFSYYSGITSADVWVSLGMVDYFRLLVNFFFCF
jgi:hypothetical protein